MENAKLKKKKTFDCFLDERLDWSVDGKTKNK